MTNHPVVAAGTTRSRLTLCVWLVVLALGCGYRVHAPGWGDAQEDGGTPTEVFDAGSRAVSRRHCEGERDGTVLAYTVTVHENGTILTECSAQLDRTTARWWYRILPAQRGYAEQSCKLQLGQPWLFTNDDDGAARARLNEIEIELACMDAALD